MNSAKEKRLGELFDAIDDAREDSAKARRKTKAAERLVDELLAETRKLILTD
jgi:vacuolar-type H+-ATPase subunit H